MTRIVRGEAPEFPADAWNAEDNSDRQAMAVGLMNREKESMGVDCSDMSELSHWPTCRPVESEDMSSQSEKMKRAFRLALTSPRQIIPYCLCPQVSATPCQPSDVAGIRTRNGRDRHHGELEIEKRKWASAANGLVIVAMVARPEMIEPQKFGVTVAANRGLRSDIFESEEEALSWLKSLE